ncbi:TSUP family transporter [Haloimpatiens sp. FM7330]|uniref:TSUP family transporter n=1 Tax=Haloimpatiens sp. FM7330 TaxID=3298610 RepID=UPI003640081C
MLKIILLCIAGFVAAFVDSIAGGGGLITVPAYLLAGLKPSFVLGTNKFGAACGSFTSSLKFAKSGKVNFKLLGFLVPFTLIGAVIGVNVVLNINEAVLNILVLVMIMFIGIYSMFSKTLGVENKFKGLNNKNIFLGIILALLLGFYDGFFGPGTGSFLIFGLIGIFGYDFVHAVGNARILNFISNITSLILFAINGRIFYTYAIPVSIFMILGARLGTKVALNKGSKLIKPIFVVMSLAVAGKMLFGLIS